MDEKLTAKQSYRLDKIEKKIDKLDRKLDDHIKKIWEVYEALRNPINVVSKMFRKK